MYVLDLSEKAQSMQREHLDQIASSPVLRLTKQVFFTVVSPTGDGLALGRKFAGKIQKLKAVEIIEQENGDEGLSLFALWSYCKDNVHSVVWYLHSKGSLHSSAGNDNFRRGLTKFVLSEGCWRMLNTGSDACGMRFTPLPHRHFPGNMWLAKCIFISRLPDPRLHRGSPCGKSEWALGNFQCLPDWCVGADRYRFEHWIGTLDSSAMADCLGVARSVRGQLSSYWLSYTGLQSLQLSESNCSSAPKSDLLSLYKAGLLLPQEPLHIRLLYAKCEKISELLDAAILTREGGPVGSYS